MCYTNHLIRNLLFDTWAEISFPFYKQPHICDLHSLTPYNIFLGMDDWLYGKGQVASLPLMPLLIIILRVYRFCPLPVISHKQDMQKCSFQVRVSRSDQPGPPP